MKGTHLLSPQIATICERLEEKKFVSYRPFLSEQVHHLLFSFWYLPREISIEIRQEIPPLTLQVNDDKKTLQIDFNWMKFLHILVEKDKPNSGCTQVEMVCALALEAELQLDTFLQAPERQEWTFDTLDFHLVHKEQIDFLLGMIHHPPSDYKQRGSLPVESLEGEFYMSFLIVITILEKALYDLYYYYEALEKKDTTSTVNKKNMILRDLLHTNLLERILPDGYLQVLKLLFLPSGLNLRNLVWHGFLSPFEFPKCFTALTFVLLFQIPSFYPTINATTVTTTVITTEEEKAILSSSATSMSGASPLFQLISFDDKYVWPSSLVHDDSSEGLDEKVASTIEMGTWWQEIETTLTATNLIPSGRIRLCLKSLRWFLLAKNELLGSFGLIPILEHTIRLCFYEIHQEIIHPNIQQAQVDEYYSTIDGFGQKTKHQVLLFPLINPSIFFLSKSDSESDNSDSNVKNLLYTKLPRGVLHGLLDLFMMAAGPNIRARLCHGEADLSTLSHLIPSSFCSIRNSLRQISRTSVVLIKTFLLLCTLYKSTNTCALPSDLKQELDLFGSLYVSSFHPLYQIARAVEANDKSMKQFNKEILDKYQVVVLPVSKEEEEVDAFLVVHFPHLNNVYIREKKNRLQDLGFVSNSKKRASMYNSIQKVFLHLEQVSRNLEYHMKQYHMDTLEEEYTSRIELSALDESQLNMTNCILEILNCIERCIHFMNCKLKTLVHWIETSQARTNHRRRFLMLIQFYPVFYKVLQWSLQMIHHQMNCFLFLVEEKTTSSTTCGHLTSILPKVFTFLTSFESCLVFPTTTSSQTQTQTQNNNKSIDKAIQLTNQFLQSKLIRKTQLTRTPL